MRTVILLVMISLSSAQIRTSSQLNCNFEGDCRWQNATGQPEQIGWTITNDIIPDDRFPLTMSKNDEGNSFAYTFGPPGMHQIELVSDIVDCQLGGAKLSFWYYFSGPQSSLDVCCRWPPGSNDPSHRKCFEPTAGQGRAQQWTFASLELPPISQSMEIVLRARYESPKDVVAIDDIKYEAILCESTHRLGSTSGGGGDIGEPMVPQNILRQLPTQNGLKTLDMRGALLASEGVEVPKSPFNSDFDYDSGNSKTTNEELQRIHSIPSESNCNYSCNFDDNNLCNFTIPSVIDLPSVGIWELRKEAMYNSITGIKEDVSKKGSFLATGPKSTPDQQYALQIRLHLAEPSNLHFAYYLAGIKGRLRVCRDFPALQECPFQVDGARLEGDARQWKDGKVRLAAGEHTITIVADRLAKNYLIGIDEFRFLNENDAREVQC
ncbi:unnamed protein product [Bursaphelenchus xylophilus]|uniref:(pine wood nematode) hypothetical protein n=1 Tax=Bursaphelenchus xylophilus TaxID=6326 RepID=A0A1I7RTJ3_BURXY|nr:unnamed protein product [Bursaphelenchus xylophilus]CAG9122399.1 unnamed protein product [Bursaphelenchus xylophilus]